MAKPMCAENLSPSLIDALQAPITLLDKAGRVIGCNAAWRRKEESRGLLGTKVEKGTDFLSACEAAPEPKAKELAAGIRKILEGGQESFETEYSSGGKKERFLARAERLKENGEVRILVEHEDVTGRRLGEELIESLVVGAGKEGQDFLKWMAGHLALALNVDHALVCEVTDASATAARSVGYWTPDGYGESTTFMLAGTPCERVIGGETACYPEGVRENFPGDPFLAHIKAESYLGVPLKDSGDRLLGYMAVLDRKPMEHGDRNASLMRFFAARVAAELERGKAETTLRDSEAHFRSMIENAQDVITLVRPDGRIRYESPAVERVLGFAPRELVGRDLLDTVHPDDRAGADAMLRMITETPGHVQTEQFRCSHKDGSWRTLEATAKRIDESDQAVIVLNARDMTERREAEDALQQSESMLRQAQKMEAIGRLAGGVAHDFNNLLTAITGYSQLIMMKLAEDDPMREEVGEIVKAGERAAGLTRQLLAFSRKQILRPKVFDLNGVIGNIEKMLRRLIGEDIRLVTELGEDAGSIKADPGQIEQVLMNLIVNARDAMSGGGGITVRTERVSIEPGGDSRFQLPPGEYATLAVQDTGAGIAPDVLPSIFEPFFTTKKEGKGTGLGLATVYGIVKQSGGDLSVNSEVGRGTTFTILLPRIEGSSESPGKSGSATGAQRGNERILLAEDEPGVRKLLVGLLKSSGYRLIEADSGEEAARLAEGAEAVDLLITDVVMPGMSGRDLADLLKRRWPRLKVIYLSGYSHSGIRRRGVTGGPVVLVEKPFKPEELTRKVREILDGPVKDRE